MDKVLANAEIKTMINAFGCGFSEGYGNDFDITKLRYDKIILMTDAGCGRKPYRHAASDLFVPLHAGAHLRRPCLHRHAAAL